MWRNWVQKAIEDLEKGKNYGNHSQRQKSVGEHISDSILDIKSRCHFKTHSRDNSSRASFGFEEWQALTQRQKTIALDACDQLHELFSVKASKEDIAKAIRMLPCDLKISQQVDHEGIALTYGMILESVSAWSLIKMIKGILCDEVEGLSDTFFPSTRELVSRDLENSLLTKANLVHKVVLNTREKKLKKGNKREFKTTRVG